MFQKELSKGNEIESFKTYLRLVKPLIFLMNREEKIEVRLLRQSSFFSALLNFCNVYKYTDFASFPTTSGADKELLAMLKNEDKTSAVISLGRNQKAFDILVKYNALEFNKKVKKALSNKITELETEIARKKDNIDDLLGI